MDDDYLWEVCSVLLGFVWSQKPRPPTPDVERFILLVQQRPGATPEQLFLADSRFFVCRNKRDWFQVRDWPQNQPWNCLGQKGVTDNECRLGWHGWEEDFPPNTRLKSPRDRLSRNYKLPRMHKEEGCFLQYFIKLKLKGPNTKRFHNLFTVYLSF